MIRTIIIFAIAVVALASVVPPAIEGGASTNLHLVVSVDGKSYFADSTELRNWTTASEYCQELGMELATITSANQTRALNASYVQDRFDLLYWTAGRESFEIREFTWNSTNEPMQEEIVDYRGEFYEHGYRTCILYNSHPAQSHLWSYDCGMLASTLCETQ